MIPQLANNGVQPAAPAQTSGAPAKFKPVDPMRFARKYIWVLLIAAVLGIGGGVGLQLALVRFAPAYTSRAQMIVTDIQGDPYDLSTQAARADVLESFMANETARIRSERVLRQVLERQPIRNTQWYQQFDTVEDALTVLRDDVLRVSPIRDSALINLVAETPQTGDDAVAILSTLIDVYTDILKLESDDTNADQRVVYQQDVNRHEERIRLMQDQIRAFTRNEEIDSLDSRTSQAAIAYRELSAQMANLRIGLSQTRAAEANMKKKVESGEFQPTLDDRMQIEQHPLVMGHSQRIQSLKERLGMFEEMGRQNSHLARQVAAQIAAAESEKQIEYNRQLEQLMQQKVESASANVVAIESQIADLATHLEEAQARVVDLNSKMARYEQLQDGLESAQTGRDRAQEALENLAMSASLPSAIRVKRFNAPSRPIMSYPPGIPTMAGMGFVLCVGGLGGLLYLREMLDQRFTSPADVALVPDAELLAVLPHADEDPSGEADINCVVQRRPNGLIAESFRQLRTDLLARVDRRGYRTVLLTGVAAEAGTTTVVQNLALSLAANARRVLVIDANLRRPVLPNALGLPDSPGLSDYLDGSAGVDDIVHAMSDLPLSVLPCGSNPQHLTAEAFESARCRELMSRLEAEFDLVLIDCPPILLTSEAKILAKHVDAAVVVTQANRDKRGMTARAVRRIDGQRADLLGVVLNGVRSAAGGYFRQNFREFYRYGNDRSGDTLRRPARETVESA